MGRPGGQLERSLAALTIGVHQGTTQRTKALLDTVTGEYEQQVHVDLSGVANVGWGFADAPVAWELPFLYAPAQRHVPFPTPHFHASFEHTAGQGDLVVFHAQVLGWTITDSAWYVGANIRFATSAPLAVADVPYSAIAHLGFQGYATSTEGDELVAGVVP